MIEALTRLSTHCSVELSEQLEVLAPLGAVRLQLLSELDAAVRAESRERLNHIR